MSTENLTDFFAAPRKAKDNATNTVNTQKKVVAKQKLKEPSIKEKSIDLKSEIEKINEEVTEKNRYQATPKKKIERKFDQFMKKSIQINEDNFMFLSNLERQISFARKKSNIKNEGLNRVTSNTVIRLLIEQFCAKAEDSLEANSKILLNLQTEEEIINWMKEM